LASGDWNKNETIDDKTVTNNNDRQKILATVASAVVEFIKYYPGAFIYVQESTPSRTRLYKMGIAAYWQEINKEFEVYGYRFREWEPFQPATYYESTRQKGWVHDKLHLLQRITYCREMVSFVLSKCMQYGKSSYKGSHYEELV
jgi:hypothetical protein